MIVHFESQMLRTGNELLRHFQWSVRCMNFQVHRSLPNAFLQQVRRLLVLNFRNLGNIEIFERVTFFFLHISLLLLYWLFFLLGILILLVVLFLLVRRPRFRIILDEYGCDRQILLVNGSGRHRLQQFIRLTRELHIFQAVDLN